MLLRSGIRPPSSAGLPSLPSKKRKRLESPSRKVPPKRRQPDQLQRKNDWAVQRPPTGDQDSTVQGPVEPSPVLVRAPLTRENLKALAMSLNDSTTTTRSESSPRERARSCSTTKREFQPKLRQNNVRWEQGFTSAPVDHENFVRRIDEPRGSPPPDPEAFLRYRELLTACPTEATLRAEIYPQIALRHIGTGRPLSMTTHGTQWTQANGPATSGLSGPCPDVVEHFRVMDYPLSTQKALGSSLQPSDHAMAPAMARFAGEHKLDGSLKQALAQAAYDGAVMVDAAYRVHRYLGKDDDEFFGYTQAITHVYNGEASKLFSNHAWRVGSDFEYHQHPLSENLMSGGTLTAFQTGWRHLRNSQMISREMAERTLHEICKYAAREDAIKEARSRELMPPPPAPCYGREEVNGHAGPTPPPSTGRPRGRPRKPR